MAFNLKLFKSVNFLCPKCAKNTEVKTADLYIFTCSCGWATPNGEIGVENEESKGV